MCSSRLNRLASSDLCSDVYCVFIENCVWQGRYMRIVLLEPIGLCICTWNSDAVSGYLTQWIKLKSVPHSNHLLDLNSLSCNEKLNKSRSVYNWRLKGPRVSMRILKVHIRSGEVYECRNVQNSFWWKNVLQWKLTGWRRRIDTWQNYFVWRRKVPETAFKSVLHFPLFILTSVS